MNNECPICLTKKSDTVLCNNNHMACYTCKLIICQLDNSTCSICRAPLVERISILELKKPWNYNTHKLQHRFNENAAWEEYTSEDNKNIIANMNLSYLLEKNGGSYDINDTFKIFWGDDVNETIIGRSLIDIDADQILYSRQKNELKTWMEKEKNIMVQRNKYHTGMRLVKIVESR
ncbi:hypothetical protein CPAV1605_1245 [seawater metagenome]|uniref:RING-type domain-containing protein n=1 Tax=seawater metagenome TaxID=1561972 RepID=A0A5E8CL11_9ZZZZ